MFFQRILNFKQAAVQARELRQNQRYAVGAGFPLHACLLWRDTEVAGRVTNLSLAGLGIVISGAFTPPRKACTVRLTVGPDALELPARLVHRQPLGADTSCGIAVEFPEFSAKLAYLQLVEAVAFGAALVAAAPAHVTQDTAWLHKEIYRGEGDTLLTVWREKTGGSVDSFEFRLADCFIRGHVKVPRLELYTQETLAALAKPGYSAPALTHFADENAEVRRLYRWVVPNLAPAVPADIREFLGRFADTG